MHSMDWFFRLRRIQKANASDSDPLKKKAEELEAALASIQVEKENELSLLRESIDVLKNQLHEDALAAQAQIANLEATLATANAKFEKAIQDHSDIQKELSLVKIQAELD